MIDRGKVYNMTTVRRLSAIAGVTLPTAMLLLAALLAPEARADGFSLGGAANYAVLYEGTGGHNLSISNVTVNGNVGVGGSGVVQFSGPGTIGGELDFSAGNIGQYHNTNGSNVGPTSVNFSVAAVTSDLNLVNSLSTSLGAEAGTSIVINGNQTINASSGTLDAAGNEVFTVTSYSEGNGNVLTINGNGHKVVLNLAVSGNPQLGGDVILTGGLTDGQVLWNYTGTNNLSLNNNASSYPLPDAFMGIILAPNAAISLVSANLDGNVYGGDSSDMQIVSGTNINQAITTPEPSSLALLASGLFGLFGFVRRRLNS
jgi:choice-of-anchor A domain-containing protein